MLHARTVANGFTRLVTTAQIAGVLLAQFAFALSLPLLPHAPLKECATDHHCGCPAELTARKACCCFKGATARDGDSVGETLIRSAHCSGTAPADPSPMPRLYWALVRVDGIQHAGCVLECIEVRTAAFRTRTIEPLVPPPKFLLVG